MKTLLCTKVGRAPNQNRGLYTLGKTYKTDDNYFNATADDGYVMTHLKLLNDSSATFVEVPAIGSKIKILDGSEIKEYMAGWNCHMIPFIDKTFTVKEYDFYFNIGETEIRKVGIKCVENPVAEYTFDLRGVEIVAADAIVKPEVKLETEAKPVAATSWETECYVRCTYSDSPDCCIQGNIYLVKDGQFTREDGTLSCHYDDVEDCNYYNKGFLEMEAVDESEVLKLELDKIIEPEPDKIIEPISYATVNTLIVRRDGLSYLVQLTKEGLILVDDCFKTICLLSDYAADGTKIDKFSDDAFDIVEIYSIGKKSCNFDKYGRELLWKRPLTKDEVKQKKIQIENLQKEIASKQAEVLKIEQEINADAAGGK